MKNQIKNIIRQSVYQLAKETVISFEKKEKKQEVNEENELKRKMLWVATLHTLLGIIYND